MKKLTAGIFATLLAVVSVDGAYAAIASKGYVDEKVGTVTTALGNKADKTAIADMLTKTEAGTTYATKESIADMETKSNASATYATKSEVSSLSSEAEKIANRVTTVSDASDNTHYPTAKAVWDVVQAETEGIASTADLTELEGRVDTAEGDIDTLQSDVSGLKTTKADKTELGNYATTEALTSGLAGKLDTGGTAAKATADAFGNVITTTYATKTELGAKANTADLGALATKDTVSATEIDADAVTTEKILDANVTKAKLASDIQTSLGKADSALQQADLADYAKTADVASTYETKENAASTYETKANASATYATKEEIAGMATDANLAKKQDKNMGAGAANHVVITDETGNITSAATIAAAKVSGLANVAKTGAYGDLTGTPSLGTLASKSTITSDDITNGTIAEADLNTTINASLDKADAAVQPSDIANMQTTTKLTKSAGWEGAKTSDDNYPSNAAVNAAITSATSGLATDSKMGDLSSLTTTVKTNLVGAINEVDTNADAAKTAADAAQEAAETAQTTAEARIPKPSGECSNPTAKCVLVSNGTNSFEWEVIARGTSEAGAEQ